MNTDIENGCIVIGAGGHAKVVMDALRLAHPEIKLAVVDADPSVSRVLDLSIAGTDDVIPELIQQGFTHFVIGVGTVGNPSTRKRLAEHACELGLQPMQMIHPAATVSRHAQLGDGVQVMAGAIINPGVLLGDYTIVNTGAIVEHDCRVGAFAHIAPGATLAGRVTVGDDAHVGLRACVREDCIIGEGALVGAGSVVVKNVPPGATVMGVPAK